MEEKKNIITERNLHGKGSRQCRRCGTRRGLNRIYGLYICRRCLRDIGPKLGFRKYD